VNPRHRPATVRFYFDADVLGLAKVMVTLRSDVTYPGDSGGVVHRRERPPCSIASPATPDEIWIPETARQGWLIITRDSRIQHHQAELDAVRNSGARMITLASDEARGTWAQLEVLQTLAQQGDTRSLLRSLGRQGLRRSARCLPDRQTSLMSQWRAIERRLEEPGPFIYTASRTVLRQVDLT
jgi:hypothetical protein